MGDAPVRKRDLVGRVEMREGGGRRCVVAIVAIVVVVVVVILGHRCVGLGVKFFGKRGGACKKGELLKW